MKQFVYSRVWLRKSVGVLLILFGLFAFIMPLVPGAVLALVGLQLIGIRLAFFDRFFPKAFTAKPTVEPDRVTNLTTPASEPNLPPPGDTDATK